MKQQKQPNPNLESARRDLLREDGPARGQLLISPQWSRQLSHYAKNRRENKTTEPPPCVIYPKGGKGNARSKPGKDMVSRPEIDRIRSRLCEGKVLAPLRIHRTRRDPRSKERIKVAKH